MSGFEALGLACCIFQTISFAHETAVACRDIYNGQKTPDSMLEDKATAMIAAAQQVKASCRGINSPEEQCLADIAEKSTSTATKLAEEVAKITKLHKKGDIIAVGRARLRSLWKRKDIDDLDNALRGYTDTMQTLLISRICNQNKASELKQREDFRDLDQHLQSFILSIDAGDTKMEDLLRTEGKLTRDLLTTEASRIEQLMEAHLDNKFLAHEIKAATQGQRERCLRSLKFEEINQRRNDITDPEDATFNRVFRSFERTTNCVEGLSSQESSDDESYQGSADDISSAWSTSNDSAQADTEEVDIIWQEFVDWLPSDHSLFWIQGKPGSGKSTLVKYIVHNNATQKLLDKWHPGTKIISHFFWRIGSPLQNNIRGLYCSLVYQLLQSNERLLSSVLEKFPFMMEKDHHHDWSDRELERVLLAVLKLEADRQPLCFFIDGLDEYCDEKGQDDLLGSIKRVAQYDRVKMCVASRPEPRLKGRLQDIPNLKLQHLTGPDIRAHIQAEFEQFERAGQISTEVSYTLTNMIMEKAEGVFLWVRLALQSVTSGIHNEDSVNLLISRLEQLPKKLEALYADMWKRLNKDEPIYRESAAMYFQFITQPKGSLHPSGTGFGGMIFDQLTLFEIVCASDAKIRDKFLAMNDETSSDDWIAAYCDKVEKEIRTRCFGLVEIRSRVPLGHCSIPRENPLWNMIKQVDFIHRTARDFLVDTEAGKRILDHGKMSTAEVQFNLIKSYFCLVRLVSRQPQSSCNIYDVLNRLAVYAGYEDNNASRKKAIELLHITRYFYEQRYLSGSPHDREPRLHFLAIVIRSTAGMGIPKSSKFLEEYFAGSIENIDPTIATDILSTFPWPLPSRKGGSVDQLRKLLSCGANPALINSQVQHIHEKFCGLRTTPLWSLLNTFYENEFSFPTLHVWPLPLAPFVGVVIAMMEAFPTTPAFDNYGLVAPIIVTNFGSRGNRGRSFYYPTGTTAITPIFQVNTSFLLKHALNYISKLPATESTGRVRQMRDQITNPRACLHFLSVNGAGQTIEDPDPSRHVRNQTRFFRVINQRPLESIIMLIFNIGNVDRAHFKHWHQTAIDLLEDTNVLEPIEWKDILKSQADPERLGLCALEDAGLTCSNELGSGVCVTGKTSEAS